MSLWLKRQQPIKLYQSSDLPYVILEDGIHLCYDNCYGINKDNSDFNICFKAQTTSLKRINTYFYKFSSFPIVLPFEQIVSLDETVIEGKTIKHFAASDNDTKRVAVMKSDYIRSYAGNDLSDINDLLEEFDHSFILVGDFIDPQVRLFESIADIIPHQQWSRTIVSIAHKIADRPERKYCWLHSLPDINLSCYGIEGSDELKEINSAKDAIGITDMSVRWETNFEF
ncbi:hypothetical protein LCGC14_2074980 [marine sediment metagenome]|uniref:Uncharacterized protein n=1 Tax=marine sediment metagenome TaxID=412755 RepID=A0A0F9HEC4_9ZZZZ